MLTACSPSASSLEHTFEERYKTAHDARDIPALMALFDWEGISPHIQTATRKALTWEFQFSIRSIEVEPKGHSYEARIEYDTPERLTTKYLLKEEAGELRILLNPGKKPSPHSH
tara:strand:+ start:1094 stop:1435 length:342 start_codon:yes stop_codon:yes gene_type:complete